MATLAHFVKWSVGLAAPTTQTTQSERDCLARHAIGKKVLVELGVWHGVTTSALRKVMSPDSVLYAIDPYFKGRLGFSAPRVIARREVSRIPGGMVRWIRKTSRQAAAEFHARGTAGETMGIDFLFIDAGHSYEDIEADWRDWSPLIKPGGIVALHDSRSSPTRNIDGVGSVVFTCNVIRNDGRFQCIDALDSLTVMRRLPAHESELEF